MVKRTNIFVAVGSTQFDTLVRAVDDLVSTLELQTVMQIGHGRYTPVNLPYLRFAPVLTPYREQASLVIAHGGLATTMEVLSRELPLVSVSNPPVTTITNRACSRLWLSKDTWFGAADWTNSSGPSTLPSARLCVL